mgnify:CR=1 FL=1
MKKKHWILWRKKNVTVANVLLSFFTFTFSFASIAWCRPSEYLLPGIILVEIPTNKPVIRIDHHDVVYRTEAAKFRAVVKDIIACHEKLFCFNGLVQTIRISSTRHNTSCKFIYNHDLIILHNIILVNMHIIIRF